ncbi:hypothetical protein EIN_180950 [Entamoeba invadens IP1]|uniref:hypothetical protein n=1 Tax=Entamoeba invadens IP1 TaxID=370355 RepID=UPI0002C3E967|nr:hypothetical protein EIN_180950 [Entamoeba invadens IP1]ELP93958.1 hypothetical protein EIN_180950 [Entamoeba invadens IP1]|eukprot:XP_004260729.1 hypothetical protein EIN_180950 [Entamoeba invadens IP1]
MRDTFTNSKPSAERTKVGRMALSKPSRQLTPTERKKFAADLDKAVFLLVTKALLETTTSDKDSVCPSSPRDSDPIDFEDMYEMVVQHVKGILGLQFPDTDIQTAYPFVLETIRNFKRFGCGRISY